MGDHVQVVQLGLLDGIEQGDATGEDIGQTLVAIATHDLVQVTLAHVGVDQQYTLAGLSDNGGQVGGDEGLADCRARTGDHQDVVLGLDHREVQAGAQAAHGLGGEVGRVVDGQQVGCSALVALEVGQALLQRGLLR